MSVVLQISDTHFGTERAPVVEALVEMAAAQRPDLVVLSGDITQRARRAQFEAARRLVERLAAPALLAIPGNHDIPLFNLAARVLAPYGGYTRVFGAQLEPSHESEDVLVIGVNTTRAYRHKHGELSPRQVSRVAARLRAASPRKLRIVVTHHPMEVTRRADEANRVRGHARAAREWADAGADLVLGGHIHLPFVTDLKQRMPELARPLWAVQAGTAVSHRLREGCGAANSVNVIRYEPSADPGACSVERWDHDDARRQFSLARRLLIALHR